MHQTRSPLQALVLSEQVSQFLDRAALCRRCGVRLATKDSKVVVYRTAFGKARLDSPGLYSRCSGCGACAFPRASLRGRARRRRGTDLLCPTFVQEVCEVSDVLGCR